MTCALKGLMGGMNFPDFILVSGHSDSHSALNVTVGSEEIMTAIQAQVSSLGRFSVVLF